MMSLDDGADAKRVRLTQVFASVAAIGHDHEQFSLAQDEGGDFSWGLTTQSDGLEQKSRARATGLAAHSATHANATGHHHAGRPVRLHGGHRNYVGSHRGDYDEMRL